MASMNEMVPEIERMGSLARHDANMLRRRCDAAGITSKERSVLEAIRDSEYRDGDLSQVVWSTGIDVPEGMTRRSMGGVFASLQEKGMVSLGGSGKESTVALLPPAIALLTESSA